MAQENVDVLPVLSKDNDHIIGIVSYKNIISSYKHGIEEHTKKHPDISMKRRGLKILLRGQKMISSFKTKDVWPCRRLQTPTAVMLAYAEAFLLIKTRRQGLQPLPGG